MKQFFALLVLAMLASCAPQAQLIKPESEKKETSRLIKADYETVWNKMLFLVQNYPLINTDKQSGLQSGLIATDWRISQQTRQVKIFRGLVFGGTVRDELPIDVKDRLNILLQKADSGVRVTITRHVQVRPWLQEVGPVGSWSQNSNGEYQSTDSNTIVENAILDALESQLAVR